MSELRRAIEQLQTNELQWRAFQTASPCVVLAPPGSGKTQLLTTRLAFDLITRIPEPHGAACITMTNAAADELRDRLGLLGVKERSNLFVGTVHAFALRCIVLPYARLGGLPEVADAKLADQSDQRSARRRAVAEILGDFENPDSPDVIGTLMQRRNLLNYQEDVAGLGGARFARLARRYEELLIAGGRYDFQDLVRYAVDLVEREEWVSRVLAARFPHLYVDEYQDLAPGLDRLVQVLCFDQRANAELFAVGDPDQAIFGFSGTAPHLLRELADRAVVNDVRLQWNFRSPQRLIDAAIQHLGEPRRVRGRREGGSIEAIQCPGGFDEQLTVTQQLIAAARARGFPLDEIAVLTRFNNSLDRAVATLAEYLPVFARRDRGYRQTPATSLVESMAAWSIQPRDGRGVRLADVIRRLRSVTRADQPRLAGFIDVLLRYRSEGAHFATDFVETLADAGFAADLERSRRAEDAQEFVRMRNALREGGSLGETTLEELGFRARARDRLLISTIHGAKGLEFDVVIILEVEEGVIPFFRGQPQEERRTFYVALTRAREQIYCLWSPWRRTRFGRRYDGPSPYLRTLGLLQP